jgi:DNA repair protein RecO (recombination protein O)
MSQRVTLEPVFVLHSRPYSNTSLIAELFTRSSGRLPVLARSARGMKSRYKGKLQSFSPMLASWSGRGELLSLGNIELLGAPFRLEGQSLLCAFYINELLMRLLHRDDPHPDLFDYYSQALLNLENADNITKSLRQFEKQLLDQLGYGLSFSHDADTRQSIDPESRYQFYPDRGFVAYHGSMANPLIFSGKNLIAIEKEEWNESVLLDAKKIMRLSISRHLGDRPLKSRELF